MHVPCVKRPTSQTTYQCRQLEVDLGRRELRVRGVAAPIGSRAFEIVEALVKAGGELLTKDQLMERVWPGAVVEENTLWVHMSAVRKALGPEREILETVAGRGYRLVGTWKAIQEIEDIDQPGPSPVEAAAISGSANNLPVAGTDLVGREQAVRELQDRLSAYRMVTLTGPGGIGKSRLALETAHRMLAQGRSDVWLIELASLSDPDLLPSAVATGLGLRIGTADLSAEVVARGIGQRSLLLLLDNCEHVVDAAARLAEAVVQLCPHATILATSREVLRIDGEYIYSVPPLDVPSESAGPGDILSASAVQLFVARTVAVNSAFSPDRMSPREAASICQRLDGIPLAIEFAAARAATIGVSEVSSHLDDRFGLLTAGRRTALPRHRTLRAALDWSYEFLSKREQEFLRALSVFRGPFALDGASAVAGASEPGSTGEVVHGLVTKSLVASDLSVSTAPLRLLDSTRAYALEKLRDHGEFDATARRHAVFYCNYLEALEGAWSSLAPQESKGHARQVDNVRAAIEWAFSANGDGKLGVALMVAAAPFLFHFSLVDECVGAIGRVLTGDRAHHARTRRQEMKLFTVLAQALLHVGMYPTMIAAWKSAYERAAELNDPEYRLRALYGLWLNCLHSGDSAGALDAARRLATGAPDNTPQADLLVGERILGLTLHSLGDHANALRHIDHMLEHYVAPPNGSHLERYQFDQKVTARSQKSVILWMMGFPEQAVRLAEDNVREATATDHPLSVYYSLALGACPLSVLVRDCRLLEHFIQRILDVSVTPTWTDWAEVLGGMLLIEQGDSDGPRHLREALKKAAPSLHYTWYLGVLARGLLVQGELGEAREAVRQALDRAEQRKEHWCTPELLRIEAEVLAAGGKPREAEAAFRQSLALAQEQGALSWSLRTATSLARLLNDQGDASDAIACLEPVYRRFTEGFDTADLTAAKRLLDELGHRVPR